MSYTLLQDNRIVVGPRDWSPRYFEYFLQELGHETSLSDSPIIEPLVFSETVKLVPTIDEQTPQINAMFEVLAGPNFKFDENNNHVSYYVAQPLDISVAKANLKAAAANVRWTKEVTPIVRRINGKELTLATDREARAIFAQALSFVPDDYSSEWKFEQGFVSINKADLQSIVSEIITHVQSCFDWESAKSREIDAAQNVEELKLIVLE